MDLISLIIPCYNEEKNISILYKQILNSFKDTKYKLEIIFVNDGSYDNTLLELKKLLNKKNFKIKIINFSRNFGKEASIYAGLENCSGKYAVLLDADLQQSPKLILNMLNVVSNDPNIDAVVYYQSERIESRFTSFLKGSFYKIIDKLSYVNFKSGASDFRLVNRKIIDTIIKMKEHNRFSKGLFAYAGFNVCYLPYVPDKRANGETKWNKKSLFSYGISGIISFSDKILRYSLICGMFLNLMSLIYLITLIILYLIKIKLSFWLVIIGIMLLLNSIQLIFMGIIGEYINRIYSEVRNRPIYITKDILKNY